MSTPRARPLVRRLRAAGFTLVELLVAMALGLVIALALVTLLINVNRNNSELTKANGMIENGRFAVQVLEADAMHGGYWGGFVPQFDDLSLKDGVVPNDYPTAVPDPCLAYASWDAQYKTNMIGIPVQAYEVADPVPSPTIPVCGSKVVSPKSKTDVLIVRRAETCAILGATGLPETGCDANDANLVYFQPSNCSTELDAGTSYVFSKAPHALKPMSCTGVANKFKFNSAIYYVRDYAVASGDGIPTLVRVPFGAVSGTPQFLSGEALIQGVEGFRVELGIDNISDTGINIETDATAANRHTAAIKWTDSNTRNSPANRGDGLPDGAAVHCTVGTPCTVAQLVNVVVAKVYILARAEQATAGYTNDKIYTLGSTTLGPFNDSYKRHLFVQTVRLHNVSMRRETP